MHAFVPKARRPKFKLNLQILDLNNVPLVSGLAYVKWHLRDSPLADSRGRTLKSSIKEHRVTWNYTKETTLKMTIDRSGKLVPAYLDLEIIQEYSGRERIILGTLEINLAGYAGRDKETRRYLMQESKINSTLQVSIELAQLSGDTNFIPPELKPPQVFSGIAGVVGNESGNAETMSLESEDSTSKGSEIASLSFRSREVGRIQDVYRRTLAASWQMQAGELNAVDCIEDIFAGGDGWKHGPRTSINKPHSEGSMAAHNPHAKQFGRTSAEDHDLHSSLTSGNDPVQRRLRPQRSYSSSDRPENGVELSPSECSSLMRERSRSHSGRVNQEPRTQEPSAYLNTAHQLQSADSSPNLTSSSQTYSSMSQGRPQLRVHSSSNLFPGPASLPLSANNAHRLQNSRTARSPTPWRDQIDVDEEHVRENLKSWAL